MKKNWQKPAMHLFEVQEGSVICNSEVSDIDGNTDISYGGAGEGEAYSRNSNVWEQKAW